MLKGITRLGAMAMLMASAACAPVGSSWSNGPRLGPPAGNGLLLNALTVNGVGLAAVAVDFAVESVELPDGSLAAR
jgi:hypothetical protein